jgi:hypothetical protein
MKRMAAKVNGRIDKRSRWLGIFIEAVGFDGKDCGFEPKTGDDGR